jgi:TetR/AcrR family transcriptional regulator, repressor for neighboring sulfatase
MAERQSSAAPRRRLTAEEARARILAAAERRLAEVGPEGLRLTELAAELGISHPAILHHFGSREELIAAVVTRAMGRLNDRLGQAIAERAHGREAIFDMLAAFYGEEGHARLIAWLVLSDRTNVTSRGQAPKPLQHLIELLQKQRARAHPERAIEYADTEFRAHLAALALLGDSIFGDMIRRASGGATGAEPSREFRRRLAKLLADTE